MKLSVSSVLQRQKEFGKHNLIDDNDETCWQSDQGSPQWIIIDFVEEINLNSIEIMFQGGFAGIETNLYNCRHDKEELQQTFYLNDDNSNQILKIALKCSKIRLEFVKSSDFYGRIVVYNLKFHH